MHTRVTCNFLDVTSDVTRRSTLPRYSTDFWQKGSAGYPPRKNAGHLPRKKSRQPEKTPECWKRLGGNTLKLINPMIKFLTANEVCEWLRVTRKALWELERAGELIPDRIGRRIRYREHEIIDYLDTKRNLSGQIKQVAFRTPQASKDPKASIEAEANETNPVSERSIYTYIYSQPESVSVADIDRQFLEDLDALGINNQLPNRTAV